jgi:acetyl-CoA carboxylase biotin carboxylase subunit
MIRALREYEVGGIRTNLGFFRQIFEDAAFREGRLHTGFIDEFFARERRSEPPSDLAAVAALAAALESTLANTPAAQPSHNGASPWVIAGRQEQLR